MKSAIQESKIGFTLVELLVVIAILVVLLALLAPAIDKAMYQAELAVCAANLRSIAVGAVTYATDHQRHYPHRPGVFQGDAVTVNWEAFRVRDPEGIEDLRTTVSGYIDLKLLIDPMSPKLDLSPERTAPGTWIMATYNLWFGYKFFPPGVPPQEGMIRLGQRLGWADAEGQYRFKVLASDHDRTSTRSSFTTSSHPDSEAVLAPQVLQETSIRGFNWSRWRNFNRFTRGTVDMNYAYDDGAVQRYDAMQWNDYQVDDRAARVSNYNRSIGNQTEWHHLPIR